MAAITLTGNMDVKSGVSVRGMLRSGGAEGTAGRTVAAAAALLRPDSRAASVAVGIVASVSAVSQAAAGLDRVEAEERDTEPAPSAGFAAVLPAVSPDDMLIFSIRKARKGVLAQK